MKIEKKRMSWIDSARGIAIILVVIGHMMPMTSNISIWIYSFHVPLFFIISGVLFSFKADFLKMGTFKELIINKVQKLLYPYLTFSILSLIYILLFVGGLKNILVNTVYTVVLYGIYTLWFLPALFFAELVFLFVIRQINSRLSALCFLMIAICTAVVCHMIAGQTDTTSNFRFVLRIIEEINRTFIASAFVYMGYFVGKFIKFISNKKLKRIWFLVLSLIMMFLNVSFNILFKNVADLHYSVIGNPLVYYINALSGSCAVLYLCLLFEIDSKYNVISFLGKNSLIIFATHLNFSLNTLSWNFVIFDEFQLLQAFVILMIFETIIIWVINKWIPWLVDYRLFKNMCCKIRYTIKGD